jgi:uncharacterized protein YdeI (YjbR/CyaY-like superfamily)
MRTSSNIKKQLRGKQTGLISPRGRKHAIAYGEPSCKASHNRNQALNEGSLEDVALIFDAHRLETDETWHK